MSLGYGGPNWSEGDSPRPGERPGDWSADWTKRKRPTDAEYLANVQKWLKVKQEREARKAP